MLLELFCVHNISVLKIAVLTSLDEVNVTTYHRKVVELFLGFWFYWQG